MRTASKSSTLAFEVCGNCEHLYCKRRNEQVLLCIKNQSSVPTLDGYCNEFLLSKSITGMVESGGKSGRKKR